VIYAKTINIDTEGLPIFEKQPQVLGNVKLTDIFPVDTVVDIRTLEGDVTIKVEDDIYMMIGLEGEVYPIRKEKLERSYKLTNEPYERSFEYDPTIKNIATGERRNILKYARGVISSGGVRVYAFMLDRHVKLFTAWDDEKYYSGNPGDYIAIREDDHHDLYIIRRRLFPKLYKEVET
jgi:phosphoglycolate phosphatase